MNVDLLHALTGRTVTSQSLKLVGLERALDMLPANIKAEVVDVAVAKSEATQRFVMTLLMRESGQKIIVESDLPAPKGAVLTLTRAGGEFQWQPPSPVQQLQTLIQLQRGQLASQQIPLPDTLQELQQWQQQLQSQPQLARPAKQQLALINQLLANNLPTNNPKPAQAAQQLEQLVKQSGAFMEAKLARGALTDTKVNDQKFLLMRLFRLLQSAPPSPNNTQPDKPTATPTPLPTITKGELFSLPVLSPSVAPKATTLLGGKPIPVQSANMYSANLVSHLSAGKTPSPQVLLQQFSVAPLPSATSLSAQALEAPSQASIAKVQWMFQPIVVSKTPSPAATSTTAQIPTTATTPTSTTQTNPNSLLQLMLARPNGQAPEASLSKAAQMPAPNQTFFLAMPTPPKLAINTANVVNTVSLTPPVSMLPVAGNPTNGGDIASKTPRELSLVLPKLLFSPPLPSPNHQFPSTLAVATLRLAIEAASKADQHTSVLATRQSVDIASFWMPLNNLIKASSKKPENNVDRLLRHVFGGIARIHTLQLDTLAVTRDSAGNPAPASQWQMEIPLPMGDRWQSATLNIIREEEDNAYGQQQQRHGETRWGMRLCFDLAPYGQLTADASLCGHRLEARFWTDGADLKARVDQHLDELINRLRDAGLFIEDIACQQGDAPPLRGKKSFDVETTT